MQRYAKLLRYDWGNVGGGGPLADLAMISALAVVTPGEQVDSAKKTQANSKQ